MKEKDIKLLWGKAAGRCSMPSCRIELAIDARLFGQMAHMIAKSPSGPRGGELATEAELDSYDNLILLCPTHHVIVDKDLDSWPPERLQQVKQEHELWVKEKLASGEIQPASDDVLNKLDKVLEEIIKNEKKNILIACFVRPDDELKAMIDKNFLREFNGPNTDYLQLLSDDLRKLFFKSFNKCKYTNEYNRICIVGREGIGKTFNSLLICKRLIHWGYSVYYCEDVRDANLSKGLISEIMDSFDEHFVFIVDNCQADKMKTSEIVKRTTKAGGYGGKPRFVFLTRPLDDDEKEDIFGDRVNKTNIFGDTIVLEFKEEYVDFDYLMHLFFKMINRSEMLDNFLSSLEQYDLSKTLFKYRNMAFWNDFFRFMRDGFEKGEVKIEEREFYKRANKFLRKDEPYLIESKDVLARLLPYFMNGISILRDYATEYLQISDAQMQKLEEEKVISLKAQDWNNKNWQKDTAMFIVSKIHPTKAKIVAALLKRYESAEIDTVSAITDYAERYYKNMYYIITPFYESETLKELCNSDRFTTALKIYFKERYLGKHLDRVIRTFAKLEPQSKDKLMDGEVISSFVEKLNDKKPLIVNKLYLFRVMYKYSPSRTYELFGRFYQKVFIDAFNNIPEGEKEGIYSLSKFMEVFKNVYYFADNEEKKAFVVNIVKEILDGCSEEFLRRFERRDNFFTQIHWFLQRLHRMKLGNYFLAKIPPAKIVEWLRAKDTNIVELSKILLKDAQYTWYIEKDGTKKSYYDYFNSSFDYSDIKRIFDNKRTKTLYHLVINSDNQMVANYLYQYSSEDAFEEKVLNTSTYLINRSIDLLRKNIYLSDKQKDFIIDKIKNISFKKKRFSNLKSKYGRDFA